MVRRCEIVILGRRRASFSPKTFLLKLFGNSRRIGAGEIADLLSSMASDIKFRRHSLFALQQRTLVVINTRNFCSAGAEAACCIYSGNSSGKSVAASVKISGNL